MKTLKDINEPTNRLVGKMYGLIPKSELQKTAKEWLRYINEFECKGKNSGLKGFDRDIDLHYYHRDLLTSWIELFFDLEPE